MREGWRGDDYFILFSDDEARNASDRYGISAMLPGYGIVGLIGWDDFILRDSDGRFFKVPTVPCISRGLEPLSTPPIDDLEPDGRYSGKVKWYLKPIVFGGDPRIGENLKWVSHEQHAELVRWWNKLYRDVTARGPQPL